MLRADRWRALAVSLILAVLVASVSGCVGLIANLIHAGTGNKVAARYDGLRERKVAVVCIDSQGGVGPSVVSRQIAQRLAANLRANVKDITLIDPQRVEDWIDENDWDYLDYYALGKGVGAEQLVAVDLNSFSLHDGGTMYKGRANVHLSVHDILAQGTTVYDVTPRQIEYPVNAGYHTTDMPERDFRQLFVETLAQRIARHFYPYEAIEDFAQDATLVGRP